MRFGIAISKETVCKEEYILPKRSKTVFGKSVFTHLFHIQELFKKLSCQSKLKSFWISINECRSFELKGDQRDQHSVLKLKDYLHTK